MITIKEWEKKTSKATRLLNLVKNHVRKIAPNADIIFYGSRARGDERKYSDWDFLILVDQPVKRDLKEKVQDSLYEIELDTDEVLSCIMRSKNEWNSGRYSVLPYKKNVEREGVLL